MSVSLTSNDATQEACSGLWRSEDMVQLQLHMQREAAHTSVLKLGQQGLVQFVDLKSDVSAFQRDFAPEIRRCDDMERKMRYLEDEVRRTLSSGGTTTGGNSSTSAQNDDGTEMETLTTLERRIDQQEGDVRELADQFDQLVSEMNRTREHIEVLSRDLHGDAPNASISTSSGGLMLLAGVIPRENVWIFERIVYRTTRGNSYMRIDDIDEPFKTPGTDTEVQKCVFSIFYSATRLTDKLRKLCDMNGATLYQYYESKDQLVEANSTLKHRYQHIAVTLGHNSTLRHNMLGAVAKKLPDWKRAVLTEKAVYSVLNMLQFNGPTVVARCWCPVADLDRLRRTLKDAESACGAQASTIIEFIETRDMKPTYFRTNTITATFQGIVDSYGMARYKEANPGVLTIITFPYLFGVMYGDIGHGLMLTLFAAFLIMMEKTFEGKPLNEIFAMIFGGRYLLFAMGVFATYLGVLYNDMFGISTEIFQSGYSWPPLPPHGPKGVVHPSSPNGRPSVKPTHPIAFGIDAAWGETDNKLEFYNSIKMKCAIVIGVIQMTVGIFISLSNYVYFHDWNSIKYRFIPEIVFLSCTFGYMSFMIVLKWCTNWENTNLAPSLLETMTNFFLAPGTITQQLYTGQATVQVILLLISFSMVPILLLGLPYALYKEDEAKKARRQQLLQRGVSEHDIEAEEAAHGGGGHGGHGHGEFDFSEVMIHQIIHTIEFVLGAVSNTASYLRLWALSLAHAELSDVFWNFALMTVVGLDSGNGVMIFIGFAVWLSASIGVLLMMESLSAFLHSLRLHWVEFQNKFYFGDGIRFIPFDLADAIGTAQ